MEVGDWCGNSPPGTSLSSGVGACGNSSPVNPFVLYFPPFSKAVHANKPSGTLLLPEHGDVRILMATNDFPQDDHKVSRDITYERKKNQVAFE